MSVSPQLHEVFKLSGVPTYTFVEPREFTAIKVSLQTPGRGLVVEGPSGIGKTTAIDRALSELKLTEKVSRFSARKSEDLEFIRELPNDPNPGIVIVDDFHKLPVGLKESLADRMKVAADEESTTTKLILLGINDAGQSLVSFAHDITHRIDIIELGTEVDNRVAVLIHKGEESLNIAINVADEIMREAQGSFFLAQLLCHEACVISGILERAPERIETAISFESIRGRVFDRLDKSFDARTRRFAQGPRMRKEGRAPYLNLLVWLADCEDWSLAIDRALRQHPTLRGSVAQVVDRGILAELIDNDVEISAVLHFDAKSRLLTVEDPQYVFYLRNLSWKHFARSLGFLSVDFSEKYDVALSFAGTDRDVAECLFDKLVERELEVFYDRNEQHRILAQDVEEYLRPIYLSDALLVVCLLGPDYPKRIWTKFEADLVRTRLQDSAVVPVWFGNAPPGAFDESRRYGGVEFFRNGNMEKQIEGIAELIAAKIGELRIAAEG